MDEDFGKYLTEFFKELSPNLSEIYQQTKDKSLDNFKGWTLTKSALSGSLLAAIPFASYVTIPADLLYLMRSMTVISYGIGAIIGKKELGENILESEDFAVILARWSGTKKLQDSALSKVSADLSTKVGSKASAKILAKNAVKFSGIMVGRSLGGKVGAKIGSKLGTKLGAKVATGWIPGVSAMVGGGVNLYILNEIAQEAESWYYFKTSTHNVQEEDDDDEQEDNEIEDEYEVDDEEEVEEEDEDDEEEEDEDEDEEDEDEEDDDDEEEDYRRR